MRIAVGVLLLAAGAARADTVTVSDLDQGNFEDSTEFVGRVKLATLSWVYS